MDHNPKYPMMFRESDLKSKRVNPDGTLASASQDFKCKVSGSMAGEMTFEPIDCTIDEILSAGENGRLIVTPDVEEMSFSDGTQTFIANCVGVFDYDDGARETDYSCIGNNHGSVMLFYITLDNDPEVSNDSVVTVKILTSQN